MQLTALPDHAPAGQRKQQHLAHRLGFRAHPWGGMNRKGVHRPNRNKPGRFDHKARGRDRGWRSGREKGRAVAAAADHVLLDEKLVSVDSAEMRALVGMERLRSLSEGEEPFGFEDDDAEEEQWSHTGEDWSAEAGERGGETTTKGPAVNHSASTNMPEHGGDGETPVRRGAAPPAQDEDVESSFALEDGSFLFPDEDAGFSEQESSDEGSSESEGSSDEEEGPHPSRTRSLSVDHAGRESHIVLREAGFKKIGRARNGQPREARTVQPTTGPEEKNRKTDSSAPTKNAKKTEKSSSQVRPGRTNFLFRPRAGGAKEVTSSSTLLASLRPPTRANPFWESRTSGGRVSDFGDPHGVALPRITPLPGLARAWDLLVDTTGRDLAELLEGAGRSGQDTHQSSGPALPDFRQTGMELFTQYCGLRSITLFRGFCPDPETLLVDPKKTSTALLLKYALAEGARGGGIEQADTQVVSRDNICLNWIPHFEKFCGIWTT